MNMGIESQCTTASTVGYNPPTLTARLKSQKEMLETQLVKVNEALTLLEASPQLQKVVDAINRVGNY